jgi:hypothetical protein
MTRLDRPLPLPAAPFHLGKQLAVQNRLRFHAPLRVPNGYQLHYRPLIGISGNGVDGVALGIAKMLDLPNNLALVIPRDHFFPPDPVEWESSRAMLSTDFLEGAKAGRKFSR